MRCEVLAIARAIVSGAKGVYEETWRRSAADGGEDRVRTGYCLNIVCHAVAPNKLDPELIELRSAWSVRLCGERYARFTCR